MVASSWLAWVPSSRSGGGRTALELEITVVSRRRLALTDPVLSAVAKVWARDEREEEEQEGEEGERELRTPTKESQKGRKGVVLVLEVEMLSSACVYALEDVHFPYLRSWRPNPRAGREEDARAQASASSALELL